MINVSYIHRISRSDPFRDFRLFCLPVRMFVLHSNMRISQRVICISFIAVIHKYCMVSTRTFYFSWNTRAVRLLLAGHKGVLLRPLAQDLREHSRPLQGWIKGFCILHGVPLSLSYDPMAQEILWFILYFKQLILFLFTFRNSTEKGNCTSQKVFVPGKVIIRCCILFFSSSREKRHHTYIWINCKIIFEI